MATNRPIAFNSLESVEWKLGVTASSSESQRIGQTFVQVKMTVQTGGKSCTPLEDSKTRCGTTASKATDSSDTVQIEMSIPKFYEFLTEMEKVKASLDHFK